MEDFEKTLESVRNEAPVETTPQTPEVTGNEVTQPTTPADDELPQPIREYIEKNPDHKTIADELNRQFKAAFTPKLQEAAELRKQYEGIDPQVAAAVRHLQQLIQTDPRNAAEYLRQQAQLLEGTQAPEAQATIPNQPEFATDVEEMLYKEVQELRRWQQEQSQFTQQTRQQQEAIRVRNEFAKLQQELGVEVPVEEMARAWELSEAAGGKLSVTDAYFALNRNTLIPSLVQKARDEASSVVQMKAGGMTPGGLVAHDAPATPSGPQTFDEIFRELSG
jgi:hypothetical protein